MAEQYKIIHPVKYYRNYLNHSIRPDGREFDKFRPIGINIGSINTADGSAIVTIGSTNVVCTIKAELAKPKAHEPDFGYIVPNVELLACSHAKYRAGDTKDAEVLTCTICNILENSDCIDLKQLCIHKEKLVWCLYCDITCLNHDGCVADAALIAILAALRNLTLPKIEYDADINKITTDISERKNIIIKTIPVATTLMAFDDNVMITDPTSEEEGLSSSLITIAVCNSEVCFSFKAGGTPFSPEQMDLCIKQALLREKSVLKLLNEVFKKK